MKKEAAEESARLCHRIGGVCGAGDVLFLSGSSSPRQLAIGWAHHRYLYAWVALLLIAGQAIALDAVTTLLFRFVRARWK